MKITRTERANWLMRGDTNIFWDFDDSCRWIGQSRKNGVPLQVISPSKRGCIEKAIRQERQRAERKASNGR